jgi:PHD/YefM family antitoxin component YafN of YafNO toxin-antitoxin module
MSITTLSAREFNQRLGEAKRLAKSGPVFVTARGRRTHVLLDDEEYQRLTAGKKPSIAQLLSCPAAADIDIEFAKMEFDFKPAEFD